MAESPPPPPPPHGSNPRPPGANAMPDGNYDIFIIPPHSAGSGFLYLPSLQPHRNSFLAGVACTLFLVGVWTLLVPVLKHWTGLIMSGGGGLGVVVLVIAVGVGAWAWGKTQGESSAGPRHDRPDGSGAGGQQQRQNQYNGHPPNFNAPPPESGPQPGPQYQAPPPPPPPRSDPPPKPRPNASADAWEKARAETRKREEERKKAEELQKKREEAQKAREEAEKAAKAKAEKEAWEQKRAREKEQREREARERIARERLAREKEKRENEAKEREANEKAERDKAAKTAASARSNPTKPATTPSRNYDKPSARSQAGTENAYSYRPYDAPKTATYKSSASSISGLSESSYAPSQSTARTTPPPSYRGPYRTNDPEKIQIKAVYLFTDSFPMKPTSQLVAGQANITDGLILKIQTDGIQIDDDVRGVAQREWDIKAWTMKSVEDGGIKGATGKALHVFRATTRSTENKKYIFVLDESEAYKVALGIGRLKKGLTRSTNYGGIKDAEVRGILTSMGWM